jgi:hypothetical protein
LFGTVFEYHCEQTRLTTREIDDFSKSVLENHNRKAAALHATAFDPPLYNVWKQQDKTSGGAGSLGIVPRQEDLEIRPRSLFWLDSTCGSS